MIVVCICLVCFPYPPLNSWKCSSFYFSDEGTYRLSHSFEFSIHYPRGVGSVLYHPDYSMLILGGDCKTDAQSCDLPEATRNGITAWRILSDMPFYKLVTDYETDLKEVNYMSADSDDSKKQSLLFSAILENFVNHRLFLLKMEVVFRQCFYEFSIMYISSGKVSRQDPDEFTCKAVVCTFFSP